jgi:GNAT acetyltransferase-like protein
MPTPFDYPLGWGIWASRVPYERGRCKKMMSARENSVEIRIRGRWIRIPALDVNGKKLIASGKWLRTAKVRSDDMMEKELENPEVYIEKLKGEANDALKADIFTFTQKLPATHPKYPYPMEWESVAAIHLTSFKEWWDGLPQETRKNARRSQKRGVTVRIKEFDDDLIQAIRQVNDESPLRQGMRNGYYGKSYEETKKLYGEFVGRCDFVCAYFGDELIGFLHLIYRGEVASILNLTTKQSHFDKRPANALMAKMVEICEAKGISYISYGLYNYGNKRDHPLRTFKIRNGFSEILMPRYFVPLNGWGRLCMKAKLHRGLIGILPHSVIKIAAGVRSLWYNSAAFMSRCSSTTERPNSHRHMERSIPPAGSNT